jgi:hypothetical protein
MRRGSFGLNRFASPDRCAERLVEQVWPASFGDGIIAGVADGRPVSGTA